MSKLSFYLHPTYSVAQYDILASDWSIVMIDTCVESSDRALSNDSFHDQAKECGVILTLEMFAFCLRKFYCMSAVHKIEDYQQMEWDKDLYLMPF